jgi:hypothetical protein
MGPRGAFDDGMLEYGRPRGHHEVPPPRQPACNAEHRADPVGPGGCGGHHDSQLVAALAYCIGQLLLGEGGADALTGVRVGGQLDKAVSFG